MSRSVNFVNAFWDKKADILVEIVRKCCLHKILWFWNSLYSLQAPKTQSFKIAEESQREIKRARTRTHTQVERMCISCSRLTEWGWEQPNAKQLETIDAKGTHSQLFDRQTRGKQSQKNKSSLYCRYRTSSHRIQILFSSSSSSSSSSFWVLQDQFV